MFIAGAGLTTVAPVLNLGASKLMLDAAEDLKGYAFKIEGWSVADADDECAWITINRSWKTIWR